MAGITRRNAWARGLRRGAAVGEGSGFRLTLKSDTQNLKMCDESVLFVRRPGMPLRLPGAGAGRSSPVSQVRCLRGGFATNH